MFNWNVLVIMDTAYTGKLINFTCCLCSLYEEFTKPVVDSNRPEMLVFSNFS